MPAYATPARTSAAADGQAADERPGAEAQPDARGERRAGGERELLRIAREDVAAAEAEQEHHAALREA